MRKTSDFLDATDAVLSQARGAGVLFRTLEDEHLDGRTLTLGGRPLINFGSCSYLGLEMDPRLKQGAIEAIQRYGTQFSSSRGYMALPLYEELESLFADIFGMPTLVAPTTTLAHASALPILVGEDDAVLLDQQAHHSVHQGMNHVRVHGVPVEIVRHNRMDLLDARVAELSRKHRKVWFLADGVYSMYGDLAPMAALTEMLDRHEKLHLYIDDAHGMSWHGDRGQGYALQALPRHPRMVVVTSLAKAFGVGGSVLAVPDAELRRRLQTVGSAFTFAGPLQPANLGAALASARLHAHGELAPLQAALRERLRLCNELCRHYGLPLYSPAEVPIRFIGAGLASVVFKLLPRLMEEGYYTNSAVFPAVPMTRAGIRFTLTLHQTPEDIEGLVRAIARHLPPVLEEEGSSLEQVFQTFDLPAPMGHPRVIVHRPEAAGLRLQHETSIEALDPAEWEALLGDRGTFSHAGLRTLEATFRDPPAREDRWGFHYFVVREPDGRPVLATFFTEGLWKDDMMAPVAVSRAVEARRAGEPGYLTSRTLSMGSLLTEGDHLYLNREADWRSAMTLVLRTVEQLREATGASTLQLRDLPIEDEELARFLLDQGYARFPLPASYALELDWDTEDDLQARLSRETRKSLRKKALRFNDRYDVELWGRAHRLPTESERRRLYDLYRAVADKSLEINTHPLPAALFERMLEQDDWEIVALRLKPEFGGEPGGTLAAFTACFKGRSLYVAHVCGLDYRFVESQGAYRQLTRHVILRARQAGFARIALGFGAAIEKERFGCRPRAHAVFVKSDNDYQMALLQVHMLESTGRR